jgi:hypothetical protein
MLSVLEKRSTIANYLRLLKLDPIIQTGIRDGFISSTGTDAPSLILKTKMKRVSLAKYKKPEACRQTKSSFI